MSRILQGGNKRLSVRLRDFYEQYFILEKLNNWVGYTLGIGVALLIGVVTPFQPMFGMGLVGAIIGIIVLVTILSNTVAGLYINAFYAFSIYFITRIANIPSFPVGVVTDLLIYITFLSLFLRRLNWKEMFGKFSRSAIGGLILINVLYLLLQFFNPNAHSFDGWYQAFRRVFGAVLLLLTCFAAFDNYEQMRKFFYFLFVLCALAGFYGCIQQWHGLFPFEMDAAVMMATHGSGVIDPNYRKFSTFPDCSAFGTLMSAAAVFYLVLAMYEQRPKYRNGMLLGVLFMIMGMGYSGTRTANAMLVAGVFMYCLLTIDKKSTRIFAGIAGFLLIVILYAPFYSNATINRFRTTFQSKQDASYQLRLANRAFIQPYIYSHPIGGGLGTTGGTGQAFNPGHFLAGFSPDGAYLQRALETGYIGLILGCLLYFLVLKRGIQGSFRSRSEKVKILCAAATASLFSLYVGEYTQVAIGQITDMVFYYPILALLMKEEEIDRRAVAEQI